MRIILIAVFVYLAAYCFFMADSRPAANLSYFVYSDCQMKDKCCYWLLWPLYKADNWATGAKHNLDREPVLIPEGRAGF